MIAAGREKAPIKRGFSLIGEKREIGLAFSSSVVEGVLTAWQRKNMPYLALLVV